MSLAGDMRDLYLPGYVNAAFHDPLLAASVVVKDDQVYVADDVDETHTFFGPIPFDVFFDVKSFTLCP